MADIKITDLVDPEEIRKLQELDAELKNVLATYTKVAKDLAQGLEVDIKVAGDIDKLEKLLTEKGKEAANAQQRLTDVMEEQGKVIANTTNTISRQLMEQERVNKTTRAAYTEQERVNKLLEHFHDTYENQIDSLIRINRQLEENKKKQKENEQALKSGRMSAADFAKAQADLMMSTRDLTQQKRTLNQILTAEEKANQTVEGSYVHLSQQLELLKKAYKELGDDSRDSDFGKELEETIQNLDAHLKDMAADMGEFQRNVGNYAIAGQQGVVATESVIAAMNQEARTTQDLIDQTRILEDAKRMLNTSDENYESTLARLNEKIEDNKRKLSDVSDIIDKDATSIAEAEAQNKRLQEALKHVDLSSDDAQDTIEKLNRKIAENTRLIRDNTPAIEDQTKATEQRTRANQDAANELLGLVGINNNFGESLRGLSQTNAGGVMEGLGTKAKALGKTLLGLLSNPWVLAFLGIAGVAAGVKWWYDYNKGLMEATKLTKDFTGLSGSELKGVRNEVQAVADSYDKDFREVLEATNALSKQFGISFQEAMQLVEDGFVAGADANGEFLENVKEYPAYFREAGLSASEFIAITTQANKAGIYSDKGIDVIKEGNLRIREMTKATAEALDAIGISSKEVQQSLADGSKTTFDIMQEVSAKLAEFPESSSEVGTALADIFGGPGEDAGLQYILTLKDIDTNLDNVKDRAGELAELQEEQMRSQVELENVIASVFDATGGSFESMTTKAKTFVNDGIIAIIKGCVDIVNWFINIYNEAKYVRIAVANLVAIFKTLWTIAKSLFELLMNGFKGVGGVIEGIMLIFSGELEAGMNKITSAFSTGFANIKNIAIQAGKEIGQNFVDSYNGVLDRRLKSVSLDISSDSTPTTTPNNRNTGRSGYTPRETDEEKKAREKAAKEAEKAAKEELKRLHELEDAKIAVMAEGHEKDLSLIRLKFKKKLDEIKGEGETEAALRVQLALQCQQEIEECERKYQTELAKINLANRLAAVKKGSEEELELKLVQLEANRAAELKAAEKTGADVSLINAKFNKEREELESEYANSLVEKIQQRYANEQTVRDNSMMAELNALQKKYSEELKLAGTNEAKRAALKEQFEAASAGITEKYAIQTARASVEMFEEMLKTDNLTAEERERIERELAAAKIALEKSVTDAAIEENDRKVKADSDATKKRIANAQQWMQVAADSLNSINELVSTIYDAKIAKVEEEQEANTEAGEAEQERIAQMVEQNVITEEEGEARKRAAEAKTAKKNEELEKKKAKLKEKQAKFDKLNSIAQCGIATAIAIMNALQMQPFPVGIAMAAIAAAMGAVQLATIIATPLPKYAKGTGYHKGGPAIVGDGGVPEVITYGGNAWITPDKPTLVDLPAGASVIPDVSGLDESELALARPLMRGGKDAPEAYNDAKVLDRLDSLIFIKQRESRARRLSDIDSQLAHYLHDKNV